MEEKIKKEEWEKLLEAMRIIKEFRSKLIERKISPDYVNYTIMQIFQFYLRY